MATKKFSHDALKAGTLNFLRLQCAIWLPRGPCAALNVIFLFVFEAALSLDLDTLLLRTHFSPSLLCFVSTSITLGWMGPCWGSGWAPNNEKKKREKKKLLKKCSGAAVCRQTREVTLGTVTKTKIVIRCNGELTCILPQAVPVTDEEMAETNVIVTLQSLQLA